MNPGVVVSSINPRGSKFDLENKLHKSNRPPFENRSRNLSQSKSVSTSLVSNAMRSEGKKQQSKRNPPKKPLEEERNDHHASQNNPPEEKNDAENFGRKRKKDKALASHIKANGLNRL